MQHQDKAATGLPVSNGLIDILCLVGVNTPAVAYSMGRLGGDLGLYKPGDIVMRQ